MATMMLIAYDVRNNNDRAKISARLQAFGNRIQRSVFLVNIDDKELDELLESVKPFLDHDVDSLVVVRQCCNCWEKMVWHGQVKVDDDELCWIVM